MRAEFSKHGMGTSVLEPTGERLSWFQLFWVPIPEGSSVLTTCQGNSLHINCENPGKMVCNFFTPWFLKWHHLTFLNLCWELMIHSALRWMSSSAQQTSMESLPRVTHFPEVPRLLCRGLGISESKETCKGQGKVAFDRVKCKYRVSTEARGTPGQKFCQTRRMGEAGREGLLECQSLTCRG